MYDVVSNGKQYQDDYIRIKKTIQEIVGRSKSKTLGKSTKSKTKNKEPQDKSERLMKQFLELQEFQKKLADVSLGSANKNKVTTSKEVRSEESDDDKGRISSSSESRAVDRSNVKERLKREEYNTDELSSDDPEGVGDDATEGTGSGESDTDIASYKSDTESKESPRSGRSSITHNDIPSVQPIKKKSVLSPSELAIIKDLCRDLIKKEEKPTEDTEVKSEKKTEKEELNYEEEGRCEKEEESVQREKQNLENEKHKTQPESTEDQKYYINTENTNTQSCNIETGVTENCENEPNTTNGVNLESLIYESNLNEETIGQEINEIPDLDEEPNEELMDTLLVKGKLMMISEHKEETITADEKIEKVHLEIVTKETVEEVDELKQRKKWSQEKLVIEKTVKVTEEDKEKTGTETEKEEQTKEQVQCNMSDDDLIQQTMREMEQIDQEFMIEEASPVEEYEHYHYACSGDGDKKRLDERIDRLQEEILSLRAQLEEAKRQNEEEAKEVEYLSAMMASRGSSLLRNGLDWDEWELREMVRERLEQKRLKAAQEYHAKLGAVEALCSAEMGKLEESLQTLLPLNATVSAWDASPEPVDLSSRSSWQTQDYVFEVVTSMNVSSSENGVSRTISTNGGQPSLPEWKAQGQ